MAGTSSINMNVYLFQLFG